MHVLANWIAKLVQILYCGIIYHTDCNSGPFCTFKWTFLCSLVEFSYILVDLSLSGGGGGGVLQNLETPPLATALT